VDKLLQKVYIVSKSIDSQETEKRNHKILLVDDDPRFLDITAKGLEYAGYQVTTAISGEAAVETLYTKDFDLVITDYHMGQLDGISLLKKAKLLNPKIKVIIVTGNADVAFAIEALRLKADGYILKPFNLDDLIDRASHCLKNTSPPKL
jgi:two-component system NtrC family response regulator